VEYGDTDGAETVDGILASLAEAEAAR